MGKQKRKTKKMNKCCCNNYYQLGIVMVILGTVTICAFFLPMKFWILLLGGSACILWNKIIQRIVDIICNE